MILIIWVVALIAVIPTYGVSIIFAIFISYYIGEKEKSKKAALLRLSICNKYYKFRSKQKLPPTRLADSEIVLYTIKYISIIQSFLEKNALKYDKEEVLLLAVRLASYEEEVDSEELKKFVDDDLNMILGYQETDDEGNVIKEYEGVMCAYENQYIPYWRNQDRLEHMELDRLINRSKLLLDSINQ